MDEERKIKVYIKVNGNNEVTEINSEIFIRDLSEWILVDEGFGDKYAHAQGNYLDKPLMDEYGNYNYKYVDGEVIEIEEEDKTKYQPYIYAQLVEQKIRTRYTVSDELAILRQRDVKVDEFDEYNAFCEECKQEAREELED